MGRLAAFVRHCLYLPTSERLIRDLGAAGEIQAALDIGCGGRSHLTQLRPSVLTVGIDGHDLAIQASKRANAHDHYIVADVLKDDIGQRLRDLGHERFDLVTMIGVVEHVPKGVGFQLLDRCEELTSKYVVVETPNGFVPQGPEFGNPLHRHLSGWFVEDFVGRGYTVRGATGTKYLRGYNADAKWPIPHLIDVDLVLARVLGARHFAQHAFNLVAMKDVRGVPARLDGADPNYT